MSKVSELHRKWTKESDYRVAYAEQEPEFGLVRALIEARSRAGLTQQQLAGRMKTTQSVIARWESGRVQPSTQTLRRIAEATGTRLRIEFEPTAAKR